MRALIGLGANLGDPRAALNSALQAVAALPQTKLLAQSSFYSTSPVDSSGPDYVNAVAFLETKLEPEPLLKALQRIENVHGRVRPAGVHNAPRTLDLDLLEYEGAVLKTAFLTLPHPRMTSRLFVLVPLAEILPNWRAPDGVPIAAMIEAVRRTDPSQQIRRLP